MGALLKKFWAWLLLKNHLIITIVVLLLLIMGAIIYFQHKSILKLKDKYQTEVKLRNALLDTMKVYQNKEGEWVAEKLTLQETLANLNKINSQLSAEQKDLLARVKEANKKNTIIAAALIESNVIIDSLKNLTKPIIDTINKNITFRDSTKNLKYDIKIGNVMPVLKLNPTLTFQSLMLPNTQFIEFHWKNDKKIGYPVAFSVTNTNDYFKTINIDSYIIPEIQKQTIKPTFWKKVGDFFTKSSNKWIWFSVGGAAGIVAGHYLLK
jgi:hypothetical protein